MHFTRERTNSLSRTMLLAALSTVASLTCCRAWGVRRGVDKDASKRPNAIERFCAAFSLGIEKSIRYALTLSLGCAWGGVPEVCCRQTTIVVRPGVSKSHQKSYRVFWESSRPWTRTSVLSSKSFC